MGTDGTTSFDRLTVGDVIAAPARTITEDEAATLTTLGGYVHPLFTDPEYVRTSSPFDRSPIPGAGVLFLLGGMAESSDAFDQTTIAMVGIDDVRFAAPAFGGDTLHLDMEVLDKQRSASGTRGTVRLGWRCTRGGDEILSATITMLFRCEP